MLRAVLVLSLITHCVACHGSGIDNSMAQRSTGGMVSNVIGGDDGGSNKNVSGGVQAPVDGGGVSSNSQSQEPNRPQTPLPEDVDYLPATPPVIRLTQTQIENSIKDTFGNDVPVPKIADPDLTEGGFKSVGAALSAPSIRGVESIEKMAYAVASKVLSVENRTQSIQCNPREDDCARSFIERRGRQLWRRKLTSEEVERLFELFVRSRTRLGDAYQGLEFVLAALLQSPHFIFRHEPSKGGLYTDYALASKLSYLLWNTTPDDALLAAAEAGKLRKTDGLKQQIERLLDAPRSQPALLRFFEQWFHLEELEQLNKDPSVFTAMTSDLGAMAREETLLNIAEVIFNEDSDLRNLLTRERTFVNRKLAAMYGIRAPSREGFGEVELTRSGQRRGLFGQLSFLALHSHPVSTSATLRGLFVREALLCQTVPPPPADVDTSIPEPSGRRQTLRDRVDEHLTSDSCRGCHLLTDPIGLAFENFDGIGVFRETDNGGQIDPSGDFDGRVFQDAWTLAEELRTHPDFPGCVVRNLHRFITGRIETAEHKEMLDAFTGRFASNGFRFRPLLVEMLESRIFREASDVEEVRP